MKEEAGRNWEMKEEASTNCGLEEEVSKQQQQLLGEEVSKRQKLDGEQER